MKSLVTGGAGFLGAHLARELQQRGHEVVVLDDLSGGFEDNVPSGARLLVGSVVDHALVDRLFDEHRFDYCWHLAAYAAEGLSHFIRRFNYTNNLIGSVNLINASVRHEVKRFVFTSSIAVYGAGELPLTEAQIPHPVDPYGIAKLAVERDLAAASATFGLPYTVFRPHNVYGELQNLGDRYRNVVGIFMSQVMRGEPLTIFGDGEQTRAFSYVGDVVPTIARCIDEDASAGEIYNVGGDEVVSVNRLADVVLSVLGAEVDKRYLEARHEVTHAHADHAKVRATFGDVRLTPLEDGVARMWAWAESKGARRGARFTDIEIERGLPRVWLDGE